jgi:hypothetical protein
MCISSHEAHQFVFSYLEELSSCPSRDTGSSECGFRNFLQLLQLCAGYHLAYISAARFEIPHNWSFTSDPTFQWYMIRIITESKAFPPQNANFRLRTLIFFIHNFVPSFYFHKEIPVYHSRYLKFWAICEKCRKKKIECLIVLKYTLQQRISNERISLQERQEHVQSQTGQRCEYK